MMACNLNPAMTKRYRKRKLWCFEGRGKTRAVECKVSTGTASEMQRRRVRLLQRSGPVGQLACPQREGRD